MKDVSYKAGLHNIKLNLAFDKQSYFTNDRRTRKTKMKMKNEKNSSTLWL